MRRSRVSFTLPLSAAAALVLVSTGTAAVASFAGCAASDERPAVAVDPLEASVPDGSVVTEEAAAPLPGYDGGVGLGLVDIPDTPCATRGGALAVVLPAGSDPSAAPPSFRSLHDVGGRRVADTTDGSGFVVFDADGKNAKLVDATPIPAGASTVLGSQILFGGKGGKSVINRAVLQPYDANGAAAGASVQLSNELPDTINGVATGADDKAALLVWTTSHAVRARGFAGGAAAGDGAYDLALTSKLNAPTMAVSSVQSGLFAVVFSGDDTSSGYQTAFGRGSSTARAGDPSNLFSGSVPRSVVGLVRTTSGFALLVTVNDAANPYAMLVLTNAGGRRTSAGLKLLGASEASAIAVNGAEIGVLAHRREGSAFESKRTTEFRAFDLAGKPLGPWVCMEPPGDASPLGGGLVAEGNGYAAIFQAADGSTSLARFDHLGTGTR